MYFEGRIFTSEGKPMANALVLLYRFDREESVGSSKTDGHGWWLMPKEEGVDYSHLVIHCVHGGVRRIDLAYMSDVYAG